MYFYAQVDANGRCFASLTTHSPIQKEGCIPVPSDPDAYVGRTYSDGAWSPP